MPDTAAARQGVRTPAVDAVEASEFAELRSLIIGPEQRQLRTLQSRLDDPATQARDVSRVLPVAMLLRKNDPQMTRALAPTVEEAITASVRRNPRPLADALFPIFGPAIRKAIAASLSSMLDSLNQTLEHSLSWRAIQWRITAWRTGKSFAEVVLLNTLVYRVEQVFLIDRASGLLLQHVKSGAIAITDADMVSGMLTAIREFARDSFRVAEDDALENFQVGDVSVWIAQGPHAMLAAVVRGTAPPELRQTLQEAIEQVHARVGEALATFTGDTEPFDVVRPTLEGCLESRYHARKSGLSPLLWAVAAAGILALGVWMYVALAARSRWDAYLHALRAEPGIVVVSSGRQNGKYVVNGLLDPLARDPGSLLAGSGISADDVAGKWQLYQALDQPIVQVRARQLLRAPAGVDLAFTDGVLTASGAAPAEWIGESVRLAPLVPGVARYDPRPVIAEQIQTISDQLAGAPIRFIRGSTAYEAGGQELLTAHLGRIRSLDALAQMSGRRYGIEVVGHADGDGVPSVNDSLSTRRADIVRTAIESLHLANVATVTAAGVGSRQPLTQDSSEAAKQANRRVSLRIVPAP
jgi:outer membrane protein OmpA-like peptidoglycan-associated protein